MTAITTLIWEIDDSFLDDVVDGVGDVDDDLNPLDDIFGGER